MTSKNEYGLTPQQERFAQEVASGKNQSEAYRLAYPNSKSWKPETVWKRSSELMSNGEVLGRVATLQKETAAGVVLENQVIIRAIAALCFSDIGGIMHADGRVKLPHELDAATRAAVASFEIDEYGRIKYKFWDKNAALEKAAKIQGLYEKDNRQKVDPLAELLQSLSGNVVGVKE